MTAPRRNLKSALLKETALFLGLLLVGILVLPVVIWFVGQAFFGEYGGGGFGDFYARLHYELRSGHLVSLYLVLSPYLCWQMLRLCFRGIRRPSSPGTSTGG
jgi:hypothetical protein